MAGHALGNQGDLARRRPKSSALVDEAEAAGDLTMTVFGHT